MNFKNINIGALIKEIVAQSGIDMSRICSFLKCSEEEVISMYSEENLDTNTLLRWSKLLEYDFFRLYSQHLILYSLLKKEQNKNIKTQLPQFRKNIYTKEMIDFILEKINKGEKTCSEAINDYGIPKTTLYKWVKKYNN
ncbi:transposase [Chryseobacterium panacisoli]|uniref:Transposase n=1 Tax=Chryseobacterium panacisoli TaxID=1807141 RepID=A0A5D8ZFX6_9FLAO|nr:transposase [Chryseobacterium panacisoli]TZF93490.1 transposase [Chryseobacterium panacisoli]